MYFHDDSIEETYDVFHEKLATLLKIDNRPFPYDYIHITDREAALKNSKEKYFPNSLHLFCHKHMSDNLNANTTYRKNSNEQKDLENLVMGDMAGCESVEEFYSLKEKVPETAFRGNYFENFCSDLLNYIVEPRWKAPRVIPKFQKSNAIEALNASAKREIEHTPRSLPELVTLMKQLVQDAKDNMCQALYGEGKSHCS